MTPTHVCGCHASFLFSQDRDDLFLGELVFAHCLYPFVLPPTKLDHYCLEFPVVRNLAGRRPQDTRIEVHGSAKGARHQAEQGSNSDCNDLPR